MSDKIKSKALEANLAEHRVNVSVDPRYESLQEVVSSYYGLKEGIQVFLEELSHPHRNWQFIVNEAKAYSLDYIHLLRNHPKGIEAAKQFMDIFFLAMEQNKNDEARGEAVDGSLRYIEQLLQEKQDDLRRFAPVILSAIVRICETEPLLFFRFVKSYYRISRISVQIAQLPEEIFPDLSPVVFLMSRYLLVTYQYWPGEDDPWIWFQRGAKEVGDVGVLKELFKSVTHAEIHAQNIKLETFLRETEKMNPKERLHELMTFPGYHQIVEIYRSLPKKIFDAEQDPTIANRWKILFLFRIMGVPGLSAIHEEALRDIGRTLKWLIGSKRPWHVNELIVKTCSIIREQMSHFPNTTLTIVVNMGREVYKTGDADLIQFFIDQVIDLGFQTPDIGGVGNDWQVRVNSAHLHNIRTWLELISINPKLSTRLISCLIIYLSIYGVFIKDTDLFPRDITSLLNSNVEPAYNLIKQLTRLFPVYFNDIGAEGRLRDISTRLDEIVYRKDALVHFLRKQSHVESSNRTLALIREVLLFWASGDKSALEEMIPPNIYEQTMMEGPYFDGIHRIFSILTQKGIQIPEDLLSVSPEELASLLSDISDVTDTDRERSILASRFYRFLHEKYNIHDVALQQYISQIQAESPLELKSLVDALNERQNKNKQIKLLRFSEKLKKLVLSPMEFEIRENIYKKRHFAVDIPSMYGSYSEKKFDALGMTFRVEWVINRLFEELVEELDLTLITKSTFYQIYSNLRLFYEALKLDGITSGEYETQMDLLAHSLEVQGFTLTQYLDIFKGFAQALKNIVTDYFRNVHEANLNRLLKKLDVEKVLPRFLSADSEMNTNAERLKLRISEMFFRDILSQSIGLQQLDVFLTRILNTLYRQAEVLPDEELRQLLLFDAENMILSIDDPIGRISNLIHLGNKGYNLVQVKRYDLPVPSGFIITTELYRFQEVIRQYPPAMNLVKAMVISKIARTEKKTGKKYGSLKNPLLLSVRSGSPISQPGMMNTFLNVGINPKIAEALAEKTQNPWFAWDCYRRFLQGYGMSFGMTRDAFDAVIAEYKSNWNISLKKTFSGEQMKTVAMGYRKKVEEAKIHIAEDPMDQLFLILQNVLGSWNAPKAQNYRKVMGLSDDWGTAITIQAMVYGNLSPESGSGVVFTHSPRWSGERIRLWGDFTIFNQGEDVVSGLVNTLPISLFQQEREMRETDITLEARFPKIYETLLEWADELTVKHRWDPQEIEFTFEGPDKKDLYFLQTRNMSIREDQKEDLFLFSADTEPVLLGHGIGVSGGAMAGRIVFDLQEVDIWRKKEPETKLIVVRNDTVPDDIMEIYAADGLLTARGGLTSHAAVVAHRLEKTCVVGCSQMLCDEQRKKIQFGEVVLFAGDFISINGREGSVFQGALSLR